MYLHIGQNVLIPAKNVVGIFDIENTTQSHITRDFLARAERSGGVENVGDDIPRSFIVCEEDGKVKIFLSQLSSATLLRRSGSAGL